MKAWKGAGAPVRAWIEGVPVEPDALEQISKTAELPFVERVAVMPDVHVGIGATVGTVLGMRGAVVPAAVGVDIGCGMVAGRTNLSANDLPDSLAGLRSAIEAAIPHGRSANGDPANDIGSWRGHSSTEAMKKWADLYRGFEWLSEAYPKVAEWGDPRNHLGTLGTGNHFIEICLDENQQVWVMLHSGSRGIGGRVGNHFIALAKRECEKWYVKLSDSNLAYLPEGTQFFNDYVRAVGWAQDFAAASREVMMKAAVLAIETILGRAVEIRDRAINCHHNYVAMESHFGKNLLVTRKGAVRARTGDLGIIPGSMGTRSYIVRGKGNPESLMSCSHGAGRAMSRTEAKRRYTVEDHIKATDGVECRKDAEVVDETPAAYKSIDAVMAAQGDLVDIVHILKQVVCVKG